MAKYFINVGDQQWYGFGAPMGSYPATVGTVLGVGVTIPVGERVTDAGSSSDYGIMRVRIKLLNGKSVVRLCDADSVESAITDLPGTAAFGSSVVKVAPVRKNQFI